MNQSKQEIHLKLTCSYSLPLLSPFLSSCSLSCFSRYSQKAPLSNQKTHYPLALPHSLSLSQNISLQSASLKCFPLSKKTSHPPRNLLPKLPKLLFRQLFLLSSSRLSLKKNQTKAPSLFLCSKKYLLCSLQLLLVYLSRKLSPHHQNCLLYKFSSLSKSFLSPKPSLKFPQKSLPKLSQKKPLITETSNLPPGSFLPKLPKKLSRISHSRQWALPPSQKRTPLCISSHSLGISPSKYLQRPGKRSSSWPPAPLTVCSFLQIPWTRVDLWLAIKKTPLWCPNSQPCMDTWLLEIVTLGKIKLQKMSPKWGSTNMPLFGRVHKCKEYEH